MKTHSSHFLIFLLALVILLTACQPSLPSATSVTDGTNDVTDLPTTTPTPTPMDPQALLQMAVDHFVEASSFQMSVHEIISYQGIVADGTINPVYGEYDSVYNYLREPETKLHVQSQFRFSRDSEYTGEEYYIYEQDGTVLRRTVETEGLTAAEEAGAQSVESFLGDAYQTILQYGTQAQFTAQDADEVVYTLDHPAWYTLQGAVGFADLGLLAMQPDGDELVKDYVEQVYPNVQTVRFILHVSIADQVITKLELDNRDFMQSFFESYDQALVDQGADPEQLTRYEIQPEHQSEFMFSDYNQMPDFNIQNLVD